MEIKEDEEEILTIYSREYQDDVLKDSLIIIQTPCLYLLFLIQLNL